MTRPSGYPIPLARGSWGCISLSFQKYSVHVHIRMYGHSGVRVCVCACVFILLHTYNTYTVLHLTFSVSNVSWWLFRISSKELPHLFLLVVEGSWVQICHNWLTKLLSIVCFESCYEQCHSKFLELKLLRHRGRALVIWWILLKCPPKYLCHFLLFQYYFCVYLIYVFAYILLEIS